MASWSAPIEPGPETHRAASVTSLSACTIGPTRAQAGPTAWATRAAESPTNGSPEPGVAWAPAA